MAGVKPGQDGGGSETSQQPRHNMRNFGGQQLALQEPIVGLLRRSPSPRRCARRCQGWR